MTGLCTCCWLVLVGLMCFMAPLRPSVRRVLVRRCPGTDAAVADACSSEQVDQGCSCPKTVCRSCCQGMHKCPSELMQYTNHNPRTSD